jgi:hypothetical protein
MAQGLVASWDFADGIGAHGIPHDRVIDTSGHRLQDRCVNMPARAMTGHNWTGARKTFSTRRSNTARSISMTTTSKMRAGRRTSNYHPRHDQEQRLRRAPARG